MFKVQMQELVQCSMEKMVAEAAEQVVDILAGRYGFNAAEAKEHLGVARSTPMELVAGSTALQQMPSPSGLAPRRGMRSLFRDKILTKDGLSDTGTVLADKKHVGIYFSAHWCRGFTPKLAEWHQANAEKLGMDIVFVSSDKDQAAFDECYGEMPWLALPFSERDLKAKLSKQFKVNGVPTFVIVDSDGKLVTDKGQIRVSTDPTGAEFPWRRPAAFSEIFQGSVVDKSGAETSLAAMAESCEAVGIYFSAHWCGPCRGFTPKLAESYTKMVANGKKWDVVFASSDKVQAAYDEYQAEMPWKAFSFGDARKDALIDIFAVSAIPALIVVDPKTGKVITKGGRGAIDSDPGGAHFPWREEVPEPAAEEEIQTDKPEVVPQPGHSGPSPAEKTAGAVAPPQMLPPGLFKTISANVAKDENRDERLAQWRQLFDYIDTDNSGALSREELDVALAALSYSQADIGKLFCILDSNQDGAVDREEWSVGFDKYNSLAHGGASAAELLRVWEAGKLSAPLVRNLSKTVIVAGPVSGAQGSRLRGCGKQRSASKVGLAVDELPRLVFIGCTGCGKSSLCTALTGQLRNKSSFPVGSGAKSETTACEVAELHWFGDEQQEKFMLIDTPGLNDSEGGDELHIKNIVDEMKKLEYVSAIVLVLNGTDPRFSQSLQAMVDKFETVFTGDSGCNGHENFYDNLVICFQRWKLDEFAAKDRKEDGITEEMTRQDFIHQFREKFPQCKVHAKALPCIFVDSHDHNVDRRAENLLKLKEAIPEDVFRTGDLEQIVPRLTGFDATEQVIEIGKPILPMKPVLIDGRVKVIKWHISPELPTGLQMCPELGIITGIPAAPTATACRYTIEAESLGGKSKPFTLENVEVMLSDVLIGQKVQEHCAKFSEQVTDIGEGSEPTNEKGLDDLIKKIAAASIACIAEAKTQLEMEFGQKRQLVKVGKQVKLGIDETQTSIEMDLKDKYHRFAKAGLETKLALNKAEQALRHLMLQGSDDYRVFKRHVQILEKLQATAGSDEGSAEVLARAQEHIKAIKPTPCPNQGCPCVCLARLLPEHDRCCLFKLPLLTQAAVVRTTAMDCSGGFILKAVAAAPDVEPEQASDQLSRTSSADELAAALAMSAEECNLAPALDQVAGSPEAFQTLQSLTQATAGACNRALMLADGDVERASNLIFDGIVPADSDGDVTDLLRQYEGTYLAGPSQHIDDDQPHWFHRLDNENQRIIRFKGSAPPSAFKGGRSNETKEWVMTTWTGPNEEQIILTGAKSEKIDDAKFDGLIVSPIDKLSWAEWEFDCAGNSVKGHSSRRRDCHFTDIHSPSILKHLLKGGGCGRMTVSPTATGHLVPESVKIMYFGGEWCPYCPPFTAKLKNFFEIATRCFGQTAVQVIFVSGDRKSVDMLNYFGGHHGHWFAVPYEQRQLKQILSDRLNPRGSIPSIRVLDNRGDAVVCFDDGGKYDFGDAIRQIPGSKPDYYVRELYKKLKDNIAPDDKGFLPSEERDIIKEAMEKETTGHGNLVGQVKDLQSGEFHHAARGLRHYLQVAENWEEAKESTEEGMEAEVARLKNCPHCVSRQAVVLDEMGRSAEAEATKQLAAALAKLKETETAAHQARLEQFRLDHKHNAGNSPMTRPDASSDDAIHLAGCAADQAEQAVHDLRKEVEAVRVKMTSRGFWFYGCETALLSHRTIETFDVGPIYRNCEAAAKATVWIEQNKPGDSYSFTGQWWNKDDGTTSYCQFTKAPAPAPSPKWPHGRVQKPYGEFMQPLCQSCDDYRLDYTTIASDLNYVLHEAASEKKISKNDVRDKGRSGMKLGDFMRAVEATDAQLSREEVASLRFYTSNSFAAINTALRDARRDSAHPLPAITMNIQEGIKKLRAIGANDASACQELILWRGFKDMQITEEFNESGGTELAPMSTTTDLGVAVGYAAESDQSGSALLFRIVTDNNLQRGASLSWVSMFAGEAEILFPPLTFVQATGRTEPLSSEDFALTVVEVKTTLP